MIIKVCGIKSQENLEQLSLLPIDMVGLNFYPPSKRYVSEDMLLKIPEHLQKVGVFVNETIDKIIRTVEKYQLDYVQLHGNENPEMCHQLNKGVKVIKYFPVSNQDDFLNIENYEMVDLILFDTRTKEFGGSGQKFRWELLKHYQGKKPFLLAGGIGPTDVETILDIDHPALYGIDINSQFEISPGLKDVEIIRNFLLEYISKSKD